MRGASELALARYNEYPQLSEATHEERERILSDQKRFGGHFNGKGESVFGPGEEAHILERFMDTAPSQLLSPAEWNAAANTEETPRVFALDLNGHYAAAVVAMVREREGAAPRAVLQLFNTTEGSSLESPMLTAVHAFVFQHRTR